MSDFGTHTWWCGAVNHPDHGLLFCHPPNDGFVTPSRTDRQPPTSVAGAKGGLSAVAPDETKRPDLVTTHDAETP